MLRERETGIDLYYLLKNACFERAREVGGVPAIPILYAECGLIEYLKEEWKKMTPALSYI